MLASKCQWKRWSGVCSGGRGWWFSLLNRVFFLGLCVDFLHTCTLHVWTSSTPASSTHAPSMDLLHTCTLHVWTYSTQTPSLCVDYLHTLPFFVCRSTTDVGMKFGRTVWVACGWKVDRIRDTFGLHLHGIRTVWVALEWNIDRNRDKGGLHWHVIRANSGQNTVA